MDDLIFGTLATDELKLVYHRTSRSGVQHVNHIHPRDPLPGEPVSITVELGPDVVADHVACYFTVDGSQPQGSRGQAFQGQALTLQEVGVEWDTIAWGYLQRWQGQLPAQPEGSVVRYQISAWAEEGRETFADWPDVKLTVNHAANAYFHDRPLSDRGPFGVPDQGDTFSYHVDRLSPPQWAREAVIYHIFVDRFFPGRGRNWRQTTDLHKPFGGSLWGVAEKMDYIAELGSTAIWLSPVFPSPTVHGYNATDYYRVKDTLGGEEALREVISRAHQHDIRVILDLVCNHVSHDHPHFQEALSDPECAYRDWFYFDEKEDHGYRTFFGVRAMPQVNLNHPGARKWMLDVARFWLDEYGVDGYRLDHANGPSGDFWADFYAASKAVKGDSFCFGEVVEPPDVQLQYQGRMDGVLDFHLCEALRHTFGRQEWDAGRFQRKLIQHLDYFPAEFVMPTFLDNHDMDRFQFIAGGDKEALRRAARVQFQLPGPPIIYYGTEVGLEQTLSNESEVGLEASRGAMPWGDRMDDRLLAFYKNIIRERMRARSWENGHPVDSLG